MNTSILDEAKPGRNIEFKRTPGRGRPAVGKVISRSSKGLTVEAANSRLEIVKNHQIQRVIKRRGRPAKVDPWLVARAREFERSLQI